MEQAIHTPATQAILFAEAFPSLHVIAARSRNILDVFCTFQIKFLKILHVLIILQKVGDPVETRCSEFSKRPAAFDELGKSLQQIRKILELCTQKVKFSIIE